MNKEMYLLGIEYVSLSWFITCCWSTTTEHYKYTYCEQKWKI